MTANCQIDINAQRLPIGKYFRLMRSGIDFTSLLTEVREQEGAWLIDTKRQDRIQVQRETNTIFLRNAVRRTDLNTNDNQESVFTQTSQCFPKAVAFMTAFAHEMDADLSRATIVRLKPRSQVYSHIDTGTYYFIRDRYHLVLHSSSGSVLKSGDEQVRMKAGELWWFDNKQYHEAFNESDEWRIHYIFDLLPRSYRRLAINPLAPPAAFASPLSALPDKPTLSLRDFLFTAIRDRAILSSDDQQLISPNGSTNRWLIDMRRILLDAGILDAISNLFWHVYADKLPFQIGGMEVAAIPLLSAILMKAKARGISLNGFIVRKERKTHGVGNQIEGTVTNAPIVIVDDIINSGSNLEKVRVVLEQTGHKITQVFALIDYHSPRGEAWRSKHRIPVLAPFTCAEFGLSQKSGEQPLPQIFTNVWNFASPNPNFFHRVPKSFPVADGKNVYFGSDCGTFWCLNAQTGSVVWTFEVSTREHKNLWSTPAIHDGKVFFGSYDGNVYCLNAENGVEVWRFIGADWVGSSPALAPDLGLLFVGLEFSVEGKRGSIVALSLATGEKVWEHMTKRYTHASPAYWRERQLVACGSNDNEMFLFDAVTGTVHWRFETKGEGGQKGSIRHAPAFDVNRGHVITGCADGYIYIVDVATGQEVWSVKTENTIYTVPLVVDDTAYIGSTDKHLYVLDLERRLVKSKVFVGSKIFGPPCLLEGQIYFGACNGIIYRIDPITCNVTGTHQLPDSITNAICFNPDTSYFYALTYVNQLFALKRV